MSDTAEVKLGAQTGDATASFDKAAANIDASLTKMRDSMGRFVAQNKSSAEQMERSNVDLGASFKKLQDTVTGAYDKMVHGVEKIKAVSGFLTAAIAGGAIWHEAIESMVHMRDEVVRLENVLGVGSERATQLAVALKLSGSSAEEYTGLALRMGRVLKTQPEEFTRLGVSIKDAQGNLLPFDQLMQNAFDTMQTYKAGTDQAEFALSVFGRSVTEVYGLMAALPSAQQRATQMMHELGIEMGPERQREVGAYKREVNAFKVTLEAIADKIGETILPRLKNLSAWLNEEGPTAARTIAEAMKVIATVFTVVGEVIGTIGRQIGINVAAIVQQFVLLGDAVYALAHGDWAGIAEAARRSLNNIRQYTRETYDNVVEHTKSAVSAIGKLWADVGKTDDKGPGPLKSGDRRFTPKPTGGGAEESVMAALETELARQKDAYERMKLEQGSFEAYSLEQTRNYWLAALQLQGISAKDREEIERRYYTAERAIRVEAFQAQLAGLEEQKTAAKFNMAERVRISVEEARLVARAYGEGSKQAIEAERRVTEAKQAQVEQRIRLDDIEQKNRLTTAKSSLELAKMDADQRVALHQISVEQSLAIEADYLKQVYTLEVQGMRDRIAAMANDPTSDPVKLAELKSQLLTVEQNYQKQLTQIQNQAVLERQQFALQADDAIRSNMSSFLSNLASGAKSFKQTLLDAAKSLEQALSKIAADKLVKDFFGAGTQGGDIISKITGGIFGGKSSGPDAGGAALQAAGTTLTTAGTTLEASGVTLDTSGTLLTAAAASLEAAAASLAASSAAKGVEGLTSGAGADFMSMFMGSVGMPMFAAGTPYIERTGLAIVHKGEAVVPASMNKGGKMGGGSVNVTNNFAISGPVDTRTQAQIAMQSARSVEMARRRNA